MRTNLHRINDWHERASNARYNASRLAKLCGVGLRQLERFFREHRHVCPKAWLEELRDERAIELLKESFGINEVASLLGYKTTAHFSHDFKQRHGVAPAKFALSTPDMSRFGKTKSRFGKSISSKVVE